MPLRLLPLWGDTRDASHPRPARGDAAQRRVSGALLVVSHGGPLRALLCSLQHIPLERYWTLSLDPASLTVLDAYPMGAIVSVLNDTCHVHGIDP